MSEENKFFLESSLEGERRPWGHYVNLYDGGDCKVKRIVVNPGESPSYQMHHKRSEVWTIIAGSGKVKLNDNIRDISPGDTILVPVGDKHTIINNSDNPLIFIEVQVGTYFGEDDIVRFEDKYGRAT